MNTFFTEKREDWRGWLEKNYQALEEIWAIFPTAKSGEKGISYNDAVEEALCFGWIDGKAGKLDDTHEIRRFSPRKNNTKFSRINIERLIWLDENGLIITSVREKVKRIIEEPFVFSEDIIGEIRKDETAWENFNRFSMPYKRIRVAFIEEARTNREEFNKRLRSFIDKTRENKIIKGYGCTDKYYK